MKFQGSHNEGISGIVAHMLGSFVSVVRKRPLLTGSLWIGAFVVLLMFSFALGIVPEIDTTESIAEEVVNNEADGVVASAQIVNADPVRIIIDSIGVDTAILNPESRSIDVLDEALLKGVVRYPGSAQLGEMGNVLLFGHSTGFRVVNNPAFKVFNNLKELKENDLIRVQSNSHEYVYRVVSVSLVNADEALVDLSASGRRLTLSTCNSFGAKQERYVVEAELVGEYTI